MPRSQIKKTDGKQTAPDAREKLLQAGVKIFALSGFEGGSTRQLAAEAGVNISAIMYYFGGKEGFYAAVLEHMAETARMAMSPQVEKIRAALADPKISNAVCHELLDGFVDNFVRFLLGEKTSVHLGRIFIREQMDPTPAFDKFYDKMIRPMHETITALVSRLTGIESDARAAILVQTIIGMAAVFKTHREVTLRRTGWKSYGEKEKAEIITLVQQNAAAIIDRQYQKGKRL